MGNHHVHKAQREKLIGVEGFSREENFAGLVIPYGTGQKPGGAAVGAEAESGEGEAELCAVGGNEKATRLSGINTKMVYFFAYANMGFLAGLAGILTVARASSAQPTYGQGYEMDAIAACFVGGASAYGGVGSMAGVIIGAVLMGVINQGMSIMGIAANYQRVVKGIVLLVAVMFDVLSKREK
jgi:ABC-type xylose transport system permease subunit